ncbi:DUF6615 family protein [Amphritea pacifica]|uniref:DUF6615 family protein n=1 Tax=Amphritea pacifica TaxID=2811233 RepID=UPI0019638E8F|nr:DUF6615 family protein [Amphritea pacifica]MBN1009125.1 hypothetical protein [Amphritea pacifica]
MNHCQSHKSVTSEVKEFILNVEGVGEESITDFLLWKWALIDKKFKSINVSSFTRHQESRVSGADFEMEVWLVGSKLSYPLVFQAKKIVKPYDAYVRKLNYPDKTKSQMNTLLRYASANRKIPFYAFYSLPDKKTKAMCAHNDVDDCGVFMAHAKVVEKFADGKHRRIVSKNDLLRVSNPFHCIFCCPIAFRGYFEQYFPSIDGELYEQETPAYVNYLLNAHEQEMSEEVIKTFIEKYELGKFRHIAVYDMRELEESPNNALQQTSR